MSLEPRKSESDGLEGRSAGRDALERFREAVQAEDWPKLQQLWPTLPVILRTSRSGRGAWAGIQRALGVHDVAGKLYYELYRESGEPAYIIDAIISFTEGEYWSFAAALVDYLLSRKGYHLSVPHLMQRVSRAMHIDALLHQRCGKSTDVPDAIKPWVGEETIELRKRLLRLQQELVRVRTDAQGISALSTIGIAFQLETEAIAAIESLETDIAAKGIHLANLKCVAGVLEGAREAYVLTLNADSKLPDVVPESTQEGFPIVLLHRGPAAFVEYSLRSLRHYHPTRRIVLLCDDNQRYDPGLCIEYRRWTDYNARAKSLVQNYEHSTINLFSFELLCLERWLVLDTFCSSHGIDEVLHFDTDVIVFDSFDDLGDEFRMHEAMICSHQPGVAYFTSDALTHIADRIQRFFEGESVFAEHERPDVISDMTFFSHEARSRGWGDLLALEREGLIDNHIHSSDGFLMDGHIKRFEFIGSQPFATKTSSGEKVRFRSIHFQGSAKSLMKAYFELAFGEV